MAGDYSLNSFKKGITLNKKYIISRMEGNANYGYFIPNNIDPLKLSRSFLLRVRNYLFTLLSNNFYQQITVSRIIRY